jgi:WD40 repeat protein
MTTDEAGGSGAQRATENEVPDPRFVPTIDQPGALTPANHDATTPYAQGPSGDANGPSISPPLAELGEYELLGEVARGGMGIVYKANHRKLNRVVALKVTQSGPLASKDLAKRFRAEAEAAAKLDHPHIVPIFEVGEASGFQFIAMAFVEGQSLAQRVATSPLPPREAAALIRQVALAVSYAHGQGVIHRDLKPGNVMLDAAGQPRVTDFGLAKRTDADSSLTQAGQVMGTPSYMPPEQAEGKNDQVGPLADVYSLGATLYFLLTGRPPFQAASVVDTLKQVVEREPASPRLLNPAVGRDLDTICLKCLEKRPDKRYPSAAALADDLQRYLEKRPIQARPVGQAEKAIRWCRRNPFQAVSLAGIVAIFASAFVLVSGSYLRAEGARRLAEQRERAERWERYRANMIAAGGAMQLNNVTAAQSALEAAPEEHRNWEWRYFTNQLDTAHEAVRLGDNLRALAVSPDGAVAAAQSATGPARLWDLRKREEIRPLPNRSPAERFWFSPDRKILAALVGGEIVLWETAAADRERAILKLPETRIDDLPQARFSPDSTRLVVFGGGLAPSVWDTTTGKQLYSLRGEYGRVIDVNFSPDGRRLAVAGDTFRTARLWNAETGQPQAVLSPHTGPVSQAFFSPQGDCVVTVEAYPGNTLRLWDAATGKPLGEMRGHTNAAEKVAFSPDGTRIASGGLDRTIRLWDGRTGQPLSYREGHRGPISSLAFSPDGKYVLSASHDRTARLWNAVTGAPLGILHGHTGVILESSARYTADGRSIVTASTADGTVRLWDAQRVERNGSLRGHDSFVYSVAFHPDGERVASSAWDGTVRVWEATTGREIRRLTYPYPRGIDFPVVPSVAFDPGGKFVAAFGRDGAVHFWDLTTWVEAFAFSLPKQDYFQDARMAFNSRGNLLAIPGGAANSVHIWDVEHRVEVAELKGHTSWVLESCFSPDDTWLATVGYDRTVRIWDLARKEQIRVLEGHIDEVQTVAVSRNGKWLASGSMDGTVRVWDTATWKEAAVLKHGTLIYSVAFSPDDTRLASACGDNMIRFWDTKTFQLVAELDGHAAYVHQIAFSPDGTRLVSGSGDYTVRVWDTLSIQERAQRSGTGGR